MKNKKGGTMSVFWDEMVDDQIKAAADRFIHKLKSKKIVNRTLPNVSEDYPLDKAFKSFQALTESEEQRKIIKSHYEETD